MNDITYGYIIMPHYSSHTIIHTIIYHIFTISYNYFTYIYYLIQLFTIYLLSHTIICHIFTISYNYFTYIYYIIQLFTIYLLIYIFGSLIYIHLSINEWYNLRLYHYAAKFISHYYHPYHSYTLFTSLNYILFTKIHIWTVILLNTHLDNSIYFFTIKIHIWTILYTFLLIYTFGILFLSNYLY